MTQIRIRKIAIDLAGRQGRYAFWTADLHSGRTLRASPPISTTGFLVSRKCDRKLTCKRALKGHMTMNPGTVKFYNDQKGYGFIAPADGGKDVFVHATALERAGMRSLSEGQKVLFDTQEDRRSGKIAVGNIQAA